jgi:Holliday junction resolvase RusA-like endonuclease
MVSEPDIRFTVPGVPRAWQRTGERIVNTKDGRQFIHHFTRGQTKGEYGAIKLFAERAMEGRPPFVGPLDFRLSAFVVIPPSWSQRKRQQALAGLILPASRPDLDNYAKMKDALKGITWSDDAQVTDEHLWKRYSDRPRVVIEIRKIVRLTAQPTLALADQ